METVGGISLGHLTDEALLAEMVRVSRAHQVLTAELVAHLAEMDARKLYLVEATPSMFAYCVARLGFSEDEACRRIDAARLARKWPIILGRIARGELSLTVLGKLKPFLTDENANELVEAAAGKSVREAERMLATRFPKPDVADSIRKLPQPKPGTRNGTEVAASPAVANPAVANPVVANPVVANPVVANPVVANPAVANPAVANPAVAESGAGAACGIEDSTGAALEALGPDVRDVAIDSRRPVDRGRMQPLAADRIQVKFTASRALEEKLELARDLMSHQNPRGDLATVIEAALDLLIADRLKRKLGQTKRPRKKARPAKRTRVTNETRREVVERDGLGCTFVNAEGVRCGARAFLEFDHRRAKANAGGSEPENVRLLCRAHNQLEAERVFGKAHMERSRRKKSKLEVRDRVGCEFVVGIHPRRRGSMSSAGRTQC